MHRIITIICAVLFPAALFAWTGPTAAPPGNNIAAPVNVGGTDQFKPAIVGANIVNIYGSNQYLNFGNTTGSTGYGIRNNGGKLEAKNSGGAWIKLIDKPWFVASGDGYGWQGQSAGTWLYPTTLTTLRGNATASYNPATALFTAPEAGLYFCFFQGYKSYTAAGYHHTISTCNGTVCNGFGSWDYTLASQGYTSYDQSTSQISGIYNLALGETIGFRMYSEQANSYSYYPPYSRTGCAKL
jgi:hypothetical protein